MKKFWNWEVRTVTHTIPATDEEAEPTEISTQERILRLDGPIAESSWYDDDVTPQIFADELNAGDGDVTVWINSPGGDCVAAAQIYNLLKEYRGKVTVKVDGLAASAASVIAMAGDEVLMSPVSTMMIHNPSTIACGDSEEMQNAAQMLDEVKESIINAYELKTRLPRRELSKLMDAEYWMNANEALEKHFIDGILYRVENSTGVTPAAASMGYSPTQVTDSIMEKIAAKCRIRKPAEPEGRSVDELMDRLDLIKNHF